MRTSADENVSFPAEASSWGQDARYAYLERLGVAEDLCMDVAPGSEAERIAAREAGRVAAGVPLARPSSRDGDVLDALLVNSDALGGLRFVRIIDDAEHKQVWRGPSIAKPPPSRLELPQHPRPDGSRVPSDRAGGR
ncbi:MAG: hypothetical protein ACKVW3_03220 [Phycisphaerales bacterium]